MDIDAVLITCYAIGVAISVYLIVRSEMRKKRMKKILERGKPPKKKELPIPIEPS